MSINLLENKSKIIAAWHNVVDDKTPIKWAIFGYEGQSDVLTVICEGSDGIEEMREELNSGKIMYAFCKVLDPKSNLNKFVLINWQGEGAPLLRKGVCANHVRDVSNILKGAHVTINARTEEDVDPDIIIDKLSKSTASSYSFQERLDLSKDGFQKLDPAYKKVEPSKEINPSERDKFWALEEEREKQRQLEEMKKRRDESLKLEEERLRRETEDAKKREEKVAAEEKPVSVTSKPRETIKDANMSISSKIQQIEKSLYSTDSSKETRQKEAEELISKRTVDVRAVFERNTSAGQLLNPGKKSAPSNVNISQSNVISSGMPVTNNVCEIVTHVVERVNSVSPEQMKAKTTEKNSCDNFLTHDESREPSVACENGTADSGLRAQALYDYQAADDTEISFDPDDIITHIEQIDPGWWQGLGPDGSYGLFPANYVQLIP